MNKPLPTYSAGCHEIEICQGLFYHTEKKRTLIDSRDLEKSWLIFLICHLFNMYREDTSTLTLSFNPNDTHMQMSYFWARMMVRRE